MGVTVHFLLRRTVSRPCAGSRYGWGEKVIPVTPRKHESSATGQSLDGATRQLDAANQSVVLVAEDSALFRKLVTTLMKREGYSVLSAADGHEGLELSRGYAGPIDLLITDVQMPRMNGIDLCNCLFQERPGIKVIFLTGARLSEFAALDATAPVLSKPIDGGFLARKVRAILATPSCLTNR